MLCCWTKAGWVVAAALREVMDLMCVEPSHPCGSSVGGCPATPEQEKHLKQRVLMVLVWASPGIRAVVRPAESFLFKLMAWKGCVQITESHYQPKVVLCPMWNELVMLDSWEREFLLRCRAYCHQVFSQHAAEILLFSPPLLAIKYSVRLAGSWIGSVQPGNCSLHCLGVSGQG